MHTLAWVLKDAGQKTKLSLENFEFSEISEDEVLAEPLIGSIEGNFVHAMNKKPENIFAARNEEKIILGNAGIVRILKTGCHVTNVKAQDICILFGNALPDKYGYPMKVTGYDNPGSMGMFGKQIKLKKHEVIPIPKNSRLSLEQWAMFSLKFVTAWSNWKSAFKAYRIQMDLPESQMHVWSWGGGVSYAEVKLASLLGCQTGMLLSQEKMKKLCLANQINYIEAGGVYPVIRPYECISRHTHIFTHYAKYEDAEEAMQFAETHDWIPEYDGNIYPFEKIPDLLEEFRNGNTDSYFQLFRVNQ